MLIEKETNVLSGLITDSTLIYISPFLTFYSPFAGISNGDGLYYKKSLNKFSSHASPYNLSLINVNDDDVSFFYLNNGTSYGDLYGLTDQEKMLSVPFSVEFSIEKNALTTFSGILGSFTPTTSSSYFFISNINKIRFGLRLSGTEVYVFEVDEAIPLNSIVTVLFSFDAGGNPLVYFNGVSKSFTNLIGTPFAFNYTNTTPLSIGRCGTTLNSLSLKLGDIRISNKVLSLNEHLPFLYSAFSNRIKI